jgi:hypothetical protein
MFLETMSFVEIRREFDKEEKHLHNKLSTHSIHVEKQMRKVNMTKFRKFYTWTSPNKNTWTYLFDFEKHNTKLKMIIPLYCLFFTERSYAVLIYTQDKGNIIYLTSHFFTRYYEREKLPGDNIDENIRTFMEKNGAYVIFKLKEVYENHYDAFIQMKEGVGLGTLHNDVHLVEIRTFITNDMLKGDQVLLSLMLDERYKLGAVRGKVS